MNSTNIYGVTLVPSTGEIRGHKANRQSPAHMQVADEVIYCQLFILLLGLKERNQLPTIVINFFLEENGLYVCFC